MTPQIRLLKSSLCTLFVSVAGIVCFASGARAASITYTDFMSFQSIEFGGTNYACTSSSDPTCAFITIVATGDTSTVQPFNVVGAHGFTNTLTTASLWVSFLDGSIYPAITADIDLSIGGVYVSVDQQNFGAGFSSTAGPTYPLATYGAATFGSYDLASTFFVWAYGPFCPDIALCTNGSSLYTTDGTEFKIKAGLGPAYSSFGSTVADVVPPEMPVPEPATLLLLGSGMVAVARRVRRRQLERPIQNS